MNRKWISIRFGVIIVLLAALSAAACSPLIPRPASSQPALTTPQVPSTGKPSVVVNDQQVNGATVVVADVVSNGPGWMVIHSQVSGAVGPAIGYTAVKDGDNKNVQVQIDPKQATPVMYAMLHIDAGQVGKYEYPGPDIPVTINGQMVTPPFNVLSQSSSTGTTPMVIVHDQLVQNGKVVIAEVDADGPAWVAVHVQGPDGKPGDDIGYSAVKPGKNTNVVVTVDQTKVTPTMYAMIHRDAGQIGMYEFPGPDMPIMVNGVMISPSFSTNGVAQANPPPTATPAAMPMPATTATANAGGMTMQAPSGSGTAPMVMVSDQPLSNGMVKVDEVDSSGPGWIVIYTTNADGQPVTPIGHTAVKDGKNLGVMVTVDPAQAKGILYAQLHIDAGKVGVFEYPGPDAPLMVGVQMISRLFHITDGTAAQQPQPNGMTPSLTIADQPIVNSSVVVPKVVADQDSWVVIHRKNGDGTMGAAVGETLVKPGVSTNVVVTLDTAHTSGTMYAMLHDDLGIKGKLEFPGPDVPVMVNGQMIAPTFNITLGQNSDVIIDLSPDTGNGVHLIDIRSMSLYISLNDKPGQFNCTGDCLNTWKPVQATGKIIAGDGVAANKLGVLILQDGTKIVTYKNAPLYYNVNDAKPGDIKGQGVDGIWFLANP